MTKLGHNNSFLTILTKSQAQSYHVVISAWVVAEKQRYDRNKKGLAKATLTAFSSEVDLRLS